MHPKFIENSLIGCDVMPSATHITASMLSSAFPEQQYKHTKILTLPFGRQANGGVSLGAIELLSTQGALSIIDTGAKGIGGVGETETDPWAVLGGSGVQDQSFDLVVMNPPFTRVTGGGGKNDDVPLPMFAAFGTEAEEQELMSERTKELTKGTAAHGNAGEASIFVQIAHNKTKVGGYIAIVLPITFLSGVAWAACRELIRRNYPEIVVVTIASSASGSFAFSADTGTGECLVVARRGVAPAKRVSSVSLTAKPSAPFEGTEMARLIREAIANKAISSLEDGPIGGTPLQLGDVHIGEMISGPISPNSQWPLFRIADHSVAQVAHQLVSNSTLWLPRMAKADTLKLHMCTFEELGEVGPYHLDVDGSSKSGGAARGPFTLKAIKPGYPATFPALDSHDMDRERTLEIAPDSDGVPRVGKSAEEKATLEERRDRIWASRSRLHLNTDFRFNSQSLTFAMTEEESIGGRAWPSFKMKHPDHEIVAAIWWNCTLGLLSYWWAANKSQDGRGTITTTQVSKLTMIDPRKLPPETVNAAKHYYKIMKGQALLPAHKLAADSVRANLDEFVVQHFLVASDPTEVLANMAVLRAKLGGEPSFNGGKA